MRLSSNHASCSGRSGPSSGPPRRRAGQVVLRTMAYGSPTATMQRARGDSSLTSSKSDASTSKVKLQTTWTSELGQVLKVVGSSPSLGSWKLESAPTMNWSEGHRWTVEIPVGEGAGGEEEKVGRRVEFKLVAWDTRSSPPAEIWERGVNRFIEVPAGSVLVKCTFGDTAATEITPTGPVPRGASPTSTSSSSSSSSPSSSAATDPSGGLPFPQPRWFTKMVTGGLLFNPDYAEPADPDAPAAASDASPVAPSTAPKAPAPPPAESPLPELPQISGWMSKMMDVAKKALNSDKQ